MGSKPNVSRGGYKRFRAKPKPKAGRTCWRCEQVILFGKAYHADGRGYDCGCGLPIGRPIEIGNQAQGVIRLAA